MLNDDEEFSEEHDCELSDTGIDQRLGLLQMVNTEGVAKSFKFFRLHEFPDGYREKILSGTRNSDAKMLRGLTCRAVALNDSFFNDEVAQLLPGVSFQQELDFLNTARFDYIVGTAVVAAEPPLDTKQVCFKPREEVGVSQWLLAMGTSEQYDPNEQLQDMPKDAKKMMMATAQNLASDRVRVAKGTRFFPTESDSAENDSDKKWGGGKAVATLDHMMRRKPAGDSESEASDSASTSNSDVSTPEQDFAGVPQRNNSDKNPSSSQQPGQAGKGKSSYQPFTEQSGYSISTPYNLGSSHTLPTMSVKEINTLPSFGKQFAAVDTIGLTADAASQARWDLDHPKPKKKALRSKIQCAVPQSLTPDSSLPTTDSTSISLSRITELNDPRFEQRAPLTVTAPEAAIEGSEPWVNHIIPVHTSSETLIDDTVSVGSTRSTTHQPGLDGICTPRRVSLQGEVTSLAGPCNLIEFDADDETPMPNKPKKVKEPTMQPPQPIRAADIGRILKQSAKNGEIIVEKVQEIPDERLTKRSTMRQTAQNKIEKNHAKTKGSGNVQLELPDPVPPPKKVVRDGTTQPSWAAAQDRNTGATNKQIEPTNAEKWSAYVADIREHYPEAHVEVQFGLILSHVQHRKGIITLKQLMGKLNAVTDGQSRFNTRLTTSIGDVFFMLNFIKDGEQEVSTVYEFSIQDVYGFSFRVTTSSDVKKIIEVTSDETVVGTAHIHCPLRVWDARATFTTAGHFEGFADFLSTLHTVGEPPAFKAKVPTSLFTVDKIYARRQYARPNCGTAGRLVVTEVQELALERLNEVYANLMASISLRDVMIKEQRLWWEAKIVCDDIEQATGIYALAESFVTRIDGVGSGNRGPWTRREPSEPEPEPLIPFW